MDFVQRLRAELKRNEMSVRELAKRTGCSYRTIEGWISKHAVPSADKLVLVATALGTTAEYLITGEESVFSSSFDDEVFERKRSSSYPTAKPPTPRDVPHDVLVALPYATDTQLKLIRAVLGLEEKR